MPMKLDRTLNSASISEVGISQIVDHEAPNKTNETQNQKQEQRCDRYDVVTDEASLNAENCSKC